MCCFCPGTDNALQYFRCIADIEVSAMLGSERGRMLTNKNQLQKLISDRKGFTLIEVVAVLVIVGILAGVAIPKFYNTTDSAKMKALQSAVAELNSQANLSFFNHMVTGGDAGGYLGYSGTLGPDFLVTGQAVDIPGNGTISLNGSGLTYNLVWSPDPTNNSPGLFTLGPQV